MKFKLITEALMENIFEILSTREKAILFWAIIALLFCLFSYSIRNSIIKILKLAFSWKISFPIFAFFIHTWFYIVLLFNLNFWDLDLLKDTLIWAFGFGLFALVNVNKINDLSYFRDLIKDIFKGTIILEFFINFYSFNLIAELIILPILVFAAMLQAKASFNQEHKQIEKLMKNIFIYFSLFVFAFSLYKTIIEYERMVTIENFKSFVLPIVLSITFIPFLYLFNLLVKYEVLWNILGFHINNKKERNRVKREILWTANFNINSVVNITQNIAMPILIYNDLSSEMIKTISKGRYVGYDE